MFTILHTPHRLRGRAMARPYSAQPHTAFSRGPGGRQSAGAGKIRVLFVCLGNICRSPAAEAIFNALAAEQGLEGRFEADSAGTYRGHCGQLPDNRMRIHARRRGLELTHRARAVEASDFEDFDLIVAMDRSNLSDLRRLAPSPQAERKIAEMSSYFSAPARYDYVPDPYYEGAQGFELVLDLLQDACANLLASLTRNHPL